MNEKISTLMDGELDRDEAMQAIRHLGQDANRRDLWDQYHLIGDVLRGESSGEITRRQKSAAAIFARLADEPTVLVPAAMKQNQVETKTRLALAMAASIVTVSAIAVVALKQQGGVVAPVQMVQQTPLQPIMQVKNMANPAEVRVNDYLAIHRQFANQNAFQTATARVEQPVAKAGGQ
jgi:sigma-E factor negative regulatory protein RseA